MNGESKSAADGFSSPHFLTDRGGFMLLENLKTPIAGIQ